MTWYDKLAFAGIGVAFVGAMMFFTGLWYAMDARQKAQSNYRASIEQARKELHR